jgi:signal recognition particle subunit SRP19
LKEYKRHVIWLEYFNSSLSRNQGRRIPLDRAVKDPKLEELAEAARRLNYSPEQETVKHPKRATVQTGYISIEKRSQKKKGTVLLELAKSLSNVRGEKAAATIPAKKR